MQTDTFGKGPCVIQPEGGAVMLIRLKLALSIHDTYIEVFLSVRLHDNDTLNVATICFSAYR